MVRGKSSWQLFYLCLLCSALLVASLSLVSGGRSVEAATCWKAEITAQWTDLSLVGSVLRVAVEGKVGLPVTVRSLGGFEAVGFTGTKPEYGPYVAEFAPLSKGTYFIEPQGLGLTYELWLDGKNYTRVDFRPVPCGATPTPTPIRPTPTVTRTPTRTPSPTPLTATPTRPLPPVSGWQSRIVQHLKQLPGSYWATIAVRVIGRPAGQEVKIQSDSWTATCKTGTKPEHGPDACEFGGLRSGTYRLAPVGLGVQRDVAVQMGDFVLIEFYQTGAEPTVSRWVGSVVKNTSGSQPTEFVNSAIAVVVAGKPWHEVEIRANGWKTTALTGTKPDYGPDACEFAGLRAATYTITPKGLDASVQVTMDGWGWAMVRFDPVTVPAPRPTASPTSRLQPTPSATSRATATPPPSPTPGGPRWKGWVLSNTSGQQPGAGVWSVIVVRVIHYGGWPVTITGGGGWSAICITGSKPEYGPDVCDFAGLWPGTYFLRPEGADIELEVYVDGLGTAWVEFAHP